MPSFSFLCVLYFLFTNTFTSSVYVFLSSLRFPLPSRIYLLSLSVSSSLVLSSSFSASFSFFSFMSTSFYILTFPSFTLCFHACIFMFVFFCNSTFNFLQIFACACNLDFYHNGRFHTNSLSRPCSLFIFSSSLSLALSTLCFHSQFRNLS